MARFRAFGRRERGTTAQGGFSYELVMQAAIAKSSGIGPSLLQSPPAIRALALSDSPRRARMSDGREMISVARGRPRRVLPGRLKPGHVATTSELPRFRALVARYLWSRPPALKFP